MNETMTVENNPRQEKNTLPIERMDRRTFLEPCLSDPTERARLVRYCQRLAGGIDVAEDIAQEALAEAWRRAEGLQTPEYWRSWLYGIARHMFLRWQQRMMRDVRRLADETPAQDTFVGSDDFTDPESALERQEMAALVDRALKYLPVSTRHLLEQHYMEGLPQTEIAGRLGITENTAAVRLHRGRDALKKVFQKQLREDAVAFGLLPITGNEAIMTHLWCPSCGKGHLMAKKDSTGRLKMVCSDCFFGMGPNPIDFPSNCIFAHEDFDPATVARSVTGYKPMLNRMMAFWQGYLFTGQKRGTVSCVGCGRELPLSTARPAHLKPYPFAGFHIHCVHCARIHVLQPFAFAFCTPEMQQFWKKNPRIRTRPARAISGGKAFAVPIESVTSCAHLDVVFSSEDYRILDIRRGDFAEQ